MSFNPHCYFLKRLGDCEFKIHYRNVFLRNITTTFGRSKESNFQLKHVRCSMKHCEIFFENGKMYLKDVGSSAGTYINNEKIRLKTVELFENTIIGMGADPNRSEHMNKTDFYIFQVVKPSVQLIDSSDEEEEQNLLTSSRSNSAKDNENDANETVSMPNEETSWMEEAFTENLNLNLRREPEEIITTRIPSRCSLENIITEGHMPHIEGEPDIIEFKLFQLHKNGLKTNDQRSTTPCSSNTSIQPKSPESSIRSSTETNASSNHITLITECTLGNLNLHPATGLDNSKPSVSRTSPVSMKISSISPQVPTANAFQITRSDSEQTLVVNEPQPSTSTGILPMPSKSSSRSTELEPKSSTFTISQSLEPISSDSESILSQPSLKLEPVSSTPLTSPSTSLTSAEFPISMKPENIEHNNIQLIKECPESSNVSLKRKNDLLEEVEGPKETVNYYWKQGIAMVKTKRQKIDVKKKRGRSKMNKSTKRDSKNQRPDEESGSTSNSSKSSIIDKSSNSKKQKIAKKSEDTISASKSNYSSMKKGNIIASPRLSSDSSSSFVQNIENGLNLENHTLIKDRKKSDSRTRTDSSSSSILQKDQRSDPAIQNSNPENKKSIINRRKSVSLARSESISSSSSNLENRRIQNPIAQASTPESNKLIQFPRLEFPSPSKTNTSTDSAPSQESSKMYQSKFPHLYQSISNSGSEPSTPITSASSPKTVPIKQRRKSVFVEQAEIVDNTMTLNERSNALRRWNQPTCKLIDAIPQEDPQRRKKGRPKMSNEEKLKKHIEKKKDF